MTWPPQSGEILPRAGDAYGVHEKLKLYSLNAEHTDGGPKARAFARILGIQEDDLDHLAAVLLDGVRQIPVSDVRNAGPHGFHCRVLVPVPGIGDLANREALVLTSWQVRSEGDAPRLVTAYITAKLK
jgi:hypothetical protein